MSSSSVSKENLKKRISKEEIGYNANYGRKKLPRPFYYTSVQGRYQPPTLPEGPGPKGPQLVNIRYIPPQFVYCNNCTEEHPAWSDTFCPNETCTICFTPGHHNVICPFLDHIPRGASYDRVMYCVVCRCGAMFFDEENWRCPCCSGHPRLELKCCLICDTRAQHGTEECPKDKIAAAGFRAKKEFNLTHDMNPSFLKRPSPTELHAMGRATSELHEESARVVRAAREREALKVSSSSS